MTASEMKQSVRLSDTNISVSTESLADYSLQPVVRVVRVTEILDNLSMGRNRLASTASIPASSVGRIGTGSLMKREAPQVSWLFVETSSLLHSSQVTCMETEDISSILVS